jgi:hypothetical protein
VPAGFYTHTATVLFSQASTLDDVARVVAPAERRVLREEPRSPWFGAADLLVSIDPERNGELAIDVVAQPWPDAMGDPRTDPSLFGAWTFGAFGQRTFPGGLARACEQAWMARNVAMAVASHVAFVRLRATYVIGAGDDAPIVPEGHSHLRDLEAITSRALAVLSLPHAIGYFDPEGELLLSRDTLDAILHDAREQSRVPIEAYTNVRLYRTDPDHSLVDSVGMERFGLPDVEIPFEAALDPNLVVALARNVCLHHLRGGTPLPSGDTIDGPGGRYRAHAFDASLVAPPRRVLQLLLESA